MDFEGLRRGANDVVHASAEKATNLAEKGLDALSKHRLKVIGIAAAGGILYGGTEYGQRHINEVNAGRNHAFTIEELDLPTKIQHLIGTTAYGNRYTQTMSKRFPALAPILRNATKAGLVHIYHGDAPSLDATKRSIAEIRKAAGHPIFISADIEGGLVNHIALTEDDLRRFKLPDRIFHERHAEYEFYLKKYKGDVSKVKNVRDYPLPSQEWLGRKYRSLRTPEQRQEFLTMMEGYGRTIAMICDHVGINIVLGPNLDIVDDIDGENPDEKNDRSYGEDPRIVRDLANAYISGFKRVHTVLTLPKHFVGNSLASTDPHVDQTRVDIPTRSGAILPYRDIINASNIEALKAVRLQEYETKMAALEQRSKAHAVRLEKLKPDSSEYKKLDRTLNANKRLMERWQLEKKIVQDSPATDLPTAGIMTSVVSTGFYGQKDIPIAYSNAVRDRLKAPKTQDGLGHTGIAMTDDLTMASSTQYIDKKIRERPKLALDAEALAVHQALAAGNEIAFIKNIAGRESKVAAEVARYIQERLSLRGRKPDLTEADVNALVKRVLDLKVRVGLLSKQLIQGKEYYVLDPKIYNPSTAEVLLNSRFSNQLPWTTRDQEPTKPEPPAWRLFWKAAYNFNLSLWRVNFPTIEAKYIEAEKNPQKLILIDKSARRMWVYDNTTRALEKEYEIGIGAGGLGERRFVGDHRTPTGTFQIVQKRDDETWRRDRGWPLRTDQPLPKEYGGIEGGMLVLAGQWHPEIAIHGTEPGKPTIGEVSNGCVRVENADIQKLLREVPVGTMVIITK